MHYGSAPDISLQINETFDCAYQSLSIMTDDDVALVSTIPSSQENTCENFFALRQWRFAVIRSHDDPVDFVAFSQSSVLMRSVRGHGTIVPFEA